MKGIPELEPREESLPASAIEAKTRCRRQPGTSYVNACFPTVWSIQDCMLDVSLLRARVELVSRLATDGG